jgi:uncharacterized protein YegP (UPF0339 family)
MYTVYKDKTGNYRWRYRSANGNIIADSAEGYVNKADCLNGIRIMKGSTNDPIDDKS